MEEIYTDKNGLQFTAFSSKDLISRNLKLYGEFEPYLYYLASLIIKGKKGIVLDIGANIGTFAIPLAHKFRNVAVIAFEVQEKVHSILTKNINLNSLSNISPINIGLSDRAENVSAYAPDYESESNIGSFSLDLEVTEKNSEVTTRGQLKSFKLVTLDSLEIQKIILMKIDVQGMEHKVIRGAVTTIKNNNYPPIIFEASSKKLWYQARRNELIKFLENMGYEITALGEHNLAQHKKNSHRIKVQLVDNKIFPRLFV